MGRLMLFRHYKYKPSRLPNKLPSARQTITPIVLGLGLVGASGIEPPTTCVSSKCSTAELRAYRCRLMPATTLL